MRQWRVGTISMGVSLILAGIVFLVTVWQGLSAFDTLIAWWPVVFIMLGGEILFYLFAGKKENPIVKYDLFSMFIVGVLLLSCFAFAIVVSSGVMKEVRYAIGAVEYTEDLPFVEERLPQDVKHVVVNTSYRVPVKIEATQEHSLHIFGQYGTSMHPDQEMNVITPDDYMSVRIIGDTAFVTVKELPRKRGPFASYTWASVVVALPEDVQVEVRDQNHTIIHSES